MSVAPLLAAGLWGMALYAQAEIHKHGGDSTRLSVACVLKSYRRMMRDYHHPVERGQIAARSRGPRLTR